MTHPTPPPAIVAPAPDPNAATLKDIVVEVNGQAYRIPISVPCRMDGLRAMHQQIALPSRRITIFVPCDGPGTLDQVLDDMPPPAAPAPQMKAKK